MLAELVLTGFLIAFVMSWLGAGGGAFYVPVLTMVFGLSIHDAVAVSLAAVALTTLVSSVGYYLQGHIQLAAGIKIGVIGLVGAIVSGMLSRYVDGVIVEKSFGIVILVMATYFILRLLRVNALANFGLCKRHDGALLFASGSIAGAMSGFLGVSGTPPIIGYLYYKELPGIEVAGTSMLAVFFISIGGFFGHLLGEGVPLFTSSWLLLGAFFGALLGPIVISRVNRKELEKWYRISYVAAMYVVGLVMLL